MNSARLLQHFHRIGDVPEAIARLRRFILDLAVQGKLVEHEQPNDDWLADLMREKRRVLRDLRLSRHPEATNPLDSEFPFQVPNHWGRLRLSDILYSCKTGYGDDPAPDFVNVAVVKVGNINNEGHFVRDFGLRGFNSREVGGLLARQNDFIIVKSSGSAENVHSGKAALCSAEHDGKLVATNFTLRLRLFSPCVLPAFVWRLLNSPVHRDRVSAAVQTLTYPNLTWSDYGVMPVALPPPAEQHSIVAKIDELMALCDRLETARAEREATRDQLAAASLIRLNAPDRDQATLADHARFALTNLAALTTRPDQVKQLRQTILNLAVRGRLVSQDPADEPASELLNRIVAEKARLARVAEIGKPKPFRPISESDAPFDLPAGWVWSSIGEICSKTGSGSTPRGGKDAYRKDGIIFLRSQNIYDDGLKLHDVAYIDAATHARMSGTIIRPSDLLLNITGGSIGRCCRVPDDFVKANISQHVAIIRVAVDGLQDFLHRLILSPYFQAFIVDEQTGAGRGGLPKNKMDRIPVALPPLAEQHRIVAKVDELMALCDRLEASLATGDDTRRHLLDALLAEALAPAEDAMPTKAARVATHG